MQCLVCTVAFHREEIIWGYCPCSLIPKLPYFILGCESLGMRLLLTGEKMNWNEIEFNSWFTVLQMDKPLNIITFCINTFLMKFKFKFTHLRDCNSAGPKKYYRNKWSLVWRKQTNKQNLVLVVEWNFALRHICGWNVSWWKRGNNFCVWTWWKLQEPRRCLP